VAVPQEQILVAAAALVQPAEVQAKVAAALLLFVMHLDIGKNMKYYVKVIINWKENATL
jgi:hypothetical protein